MSPQYYMKATVLPQRIFPSLQAQARPQLPGRAEKPLVVYVLLETDDEANDANLRYYVREGIREDDGCTHIILVDPKRVGPTLDQTLLVPIGCSADKIWCDH